MPASTTPQDLRVRRATIEDVASLTRHRVAMYREMGDLLDAKERELAAAAEAYFRSGIPSGEYVAWLAVTTGPHEEVVAGAGLLVRPMIPRPAPDGNIERCEGTVVNVYTEPDWRRKGLAAMVLKELLAYTCANRINRVSLHASEDGRPLYELLGFGPTNEMRLAR